MTDSDKQIRINRFLALCGVGSRRHADSLIAEGRVTVNGRPVDKPGLMVDSASDEVAVDGVSVSPQKERSYIVLNKPGGVLTTATDPFGRKTVLQLLDGLATRVYPVGRLDADTEGVLLLMNDGELAHRLTHPRYGIKKVYRARVKGRFTDTDARRIREGVPLEDGAIGKAEVALIEGEDNATLIELTLTEGRKREVKQLCRAVGHPVISLKRLEFASITAAGLKLGQWRRLTESEVTRLRELVGLGE